MTRTAPLVACLTFVACSASNAPPATTAPPPAGPAPVASVAPATVSPPASASALPDSELVIESDPSKIKGKKASVSLKSYEQALKSSVVDAAAETLSMKECASPVSGAIALTCKLQGMATAKLAIRDGKAVGLTVVTEPEQLTVNECMTDQISQLTWRAVPGMTTCTRTFKAN